MGKATVRSSPCPHRSLTAFESQVLGLSNRLVEAQRPIRILDAVKWDDTIERTFFEQRGRELPAIAPEYYGTRPLAFDPAAKLAEFANLEQDIARQLGRHEKLGRIMCRMCREYAAVVRLILQRGRPEFAASARELFGSAFDLLDGTGSRLLDHTLQLRQQLQQPAADAVPPPEEPTLDAAQVVALLSARLHGFFQDAAAVCVKLSDGILADAAAGCDYIKIRGDARFTLRDVRLLEVHEGWVHLGTTRNGQQQPVCTFLSKGPPSSTLTQEGLAVATEFLAGVSYPGRVRRLLDRVAGVARAEQGADFLEIYRFFLEQGYEPRESYQFSVRIFRGGLPRRCGPFTKDLCYIKGFLLVAQFLRRTARQAQPAQVPLLFSGKTALGDFDDLEQLADEGLVLPPRFVPPPFREEPIPLEPAAPPAFQLG